MTLVSSIFKLCKISFQTQNFQASVHISSYIYSSWGFFNYMTTHYISASPIIWFLSRGHIMNCYWRLKKSNTEKCKDEKPSSNRYTISQISKIVKSAQTSCIQISKSLTDNDTHSTCLLYSDFSSQDLWPSRIRCLTDKSTLLLERLRQLLTKAILGISYISLKHNIFPISFSM